MMKILCSAFLGVMVSMTASIAMADVLLDREEGIEVLAINGQEVDEEDRQASANPLRLEDGNNQILVAYTTEIRDAGNETVLDTSTTQVLLFEAQEAQLRLMAPEIRSRHEMRAFDEGNRWRLVDNRGERVPYRSAVLEKEGLQFDRDYEAELRRFNRTASPAAVAALGRESFAFDSPVAAASVAGAMPSDMPQGATNDGMSDQQMVGKMLKFWYQQASSTTRNDFQRWLSESQ
ncbi:hypothetical protein SAMN04487957_10761 [Halomonas shengliensis]|uniref:Uncharacterized protein n=1 Tax=Halomonas shengliensis TaxID=419597 RepID=A0A1H0K3X5_9GAMM|nr:DUF2057 domain-containing protein [Halomonas shengliensis]SDO50557.1 hypothetical protein SAMN04487957_10761 [Halomonas shengliensis]